MLKSWYRNSQLLKKLNDGRTAAFLKYSCQLTELMHDGLLTELMHGVSRLNLFMTEMMHDFQMPESMH